MIKIIYVRIMSLKFLIFENVVKEGSLDYTCYVMLELIYDKYNCILCYVGYENMTKINSGYNTPIVATNCIRNGHV
jgi:hypothetical protein